MEAVRSCRNTIGEETIMYRAYYGAAGYGPLHPLEKHRWPFREFSRLDEALLWAVWVAARGTAVLAIDGDDGTQLSRSDITLGALRHRKVNDYKTVGKADESYSDENDPRPAGASLRPDIRKGD